MVGWAGRLPDNPVRRQAVNAIQVLLQGECIPDIQVVALGVDDTVKDLLEAAAKCRAEAIEGEFLVFVEGSEEPIADGDKLPENKDRQPVPLHVHRCRRVLVTVTFNGLSKGHEFSPATTVADVEKFAAIREFGMKPADAAEHVLQFSGSAERPEPEMHVGALVSCPDCRISFDLVPHKRVEG